MKLVRLILSGLYTKVFIGKDLSGNFPIKTGLRQGGALSPKLCFRIFHYEGPGKPGGTEIKWAEIKSVFGLY
jgi:hypothetical protein